MEKYSDIIEKAKELAKLIDSHKITVSYKESLEKMKNDAAAQRLLAELVRIGGEISGRYGTDSGRENSDYTAGKAELDILKEEFDKNEIVKDHILIQKQYLNLIKLVQDKIKNPD